MAGIGQRTVWADEAVARSPMSDTQPNDQEEVSRDAHNLRVTEVGSKEC